MKRNCCSKCHREIDSRDFFMESESGKFCSDCLIEAAPIEAESVYLFKRRRVEKEAVTPTSGRGIPMQLEEAL